MFSGDVLAAMEVRGSVGAGGAVDDEGDEGVEGDSGLSLVSSDDSSGFISGSWEGLDEGTVEFASEEPNSLGDSSCFELPCFGELLFSQTFNRKNESLKR